MQTVFFIPSLPRMTGGLANTYAIIKQLISLGHPVSVTCPGTAPLLNTLADFGVTIINWKSITLAPDDIWIVPESWPNAISIGVAAKARTIIYVQSWVYLLTTLPHGVQWANLPVEFIAASTPIAWFLKEIIGVNVLAKLPPAIDDIFYAHPQDKPTTHVRIAFMPRKNNSMATQIQQVTTQLLTKTPTCKVEWLALHGLPLHDVARHLSTSHIFLSTGFPEGFGMPPLEAMACGCVPVGFTGLGGWEYMRQANFAQSSCPLLSTMQPHQPPFPPAMLQTQPLPANGFYMADGDTLAASIALAATIATAHEQHSDFIMLQQAGAETAQHYTANKQQAAIQQLWSEGLLQ